MNLKVIISSLPQLQISRKLEDYMPSYQKLVSRSLQPKPSITAGKV